jgi:2,5-diketo-D-gluconate reductase B
MKRHIDYALSIDGTRWLYPREGKLSIYFERTYQRSFGTFPLTGDVLLAAMQSAAEAGYRSFDTAKMYGNEADVGEGLAATGLKREDMLVTTKVHPDDFSEGAFLPAVEKSLVDLRLDHVDVLLLHWPPINGEIAPSLKLLADAKKRGLTKHIGVSNYTVRMMRNAVKIIDEPLVVNQVEFHPLLDQTVLLDAALETGIAISSYCSVARGEVFKYPLFAEIGKAYGRSAAQIVLRWILQKGVPINTMSTKQDNIRANFDIMDFTLSSMDMAKIDALTKTGYRIVGRDLVPWAPEWD